MSLRLRQDRIEHVKGRLSTVLGEWQPRNFSLMGIREIPSHASDVVCDALATIWLGHELMNLQRVSRIKHEHRIFATFAKASTPSNQSNTVVSSLVFGEHFIHSCHFRYQLERRQTNGAIFLILITYSRHDKTGFLRTWTCIREILCATQGYLTVSCTSYYRHVLG